MICPTCKRHASAIIRRKCSLCRQAERRRITNQLSTDEGDDVSDIIVDRLIEATLEGVDDD